MALEFKTIEEVYKMEQKICFHSPYHEKTLAEDIEDAFQDMLDYSYFELPVTKETLKSHANSFSKVDVYEKDYVKINPNSVIKFINIAFNHSFDDL